ncbi:MAG: ABC transporter ATP-binding protein [Alphaproteobacteria bacterium]|jgi:branched-chain amino acid transport system ATP-binding protein|uniref:ABC transporter ATP-binding protein n=1 Tax=Candidatus Levibacter sp. Uisw_134_01 TaxID=3230999 RepID=UPI001D7474B3|nr:ABC transporter ATP-binding protein [Alphaproteobacteria bacterium]MDC0548594.1 ABC transporter ATP-binding protein [Alphaproteobacteria bacterium]MDG1882573.1 ABC transporter ATP-binding protein [Alphaproteobacteria bacterium]
MKNKILNIKNLSKSYGAFKVTDEIAIDLNFNEIHALIGPNGAGKSTLIKQIVGSVKHDIGSIILDQEDITDLTDIERAKIGISRTFQVSSIIPKFSALENIILSLLNKSNNTFQLFKSLKQNRELHLKAKKILRDIDLDSKSDEVASELSHGDRRKLEVGLALAMDPKVFLFDEPMAGLDEIGTKMMIDLFKKIKANSPILLIEHDMEAVFALADRVSVIVYGKIVATGTVKEIKSNKLVRDVYLGYEI